MPDIKTEDIIRHDSLGLGQIREVEEEGTFTVEFEDGLVRTFEGGEDLKRLDADGFWAQVWTDRAAVKQLLYQQPAKAVALLLRDFPHGMAQTEQIREQLKPFVKDWQPWWKRAQPLIKLDPTIDTSRSREEVYSLAEKPRSHIEELYDNFVALPKRKDGATSSEKLAAARSVLIAVAKPEEELPLDKTESVRSFVVEALNDDAVDLTDRMDLTLRLEALGWLDDAALRASLRSLCQNDVTLYKLDQFARNRAVDAVLKHVGSDLGRELLLSAFATDRTLIGQVRDAYVARGQVETLLEGLWVGLGENLIDLTGTDKKLIGSEDLRRRYRDLTSRMLGLSEVLETLVFDISLPVDWDRLASSFGQWLGLLTRVQSIEPVPLDVVQSLTRFWRRAMAFAPHDRQGGYLDIPLQPLLHPQVVRPFLDAIFSADPSLGLVDSFVSRVERSRDRVSDTLLLAIVEGYGGWNTEVEAFSFLMSRFSHRAEVIDWVANRTIDTVQKHRESLLDYLPILDGLSSTLQDSVQREKVDGLRRHGFRLVCEEVNRGGWVDLSGLTLDGEYLAGLRDFLRELGKERQAALVEKQSEIDQAMAATQRAEGRQQRAERGLAELSRGYRGSEHSARFAEKRLVLGDFAATTAQFERFAERQGSKEMTGVVRRLNSLLQQQGVTPFGTLNEELPFDPSQHEFVGGLVEGVDRVRLVERGYMIQDMDGNPQLLKPAKVTVEH